MNWYYALDGKKVGPVTEEEFQRLTAQGVITPQTLVWREGMADWEPRGSVALSSAAEAGLLVCAGCGRQLPASEIFVLSGLQYCGACKPQVLQRITAGQPLAAPAAEEMRKAHISHEASIKSVGMLYYLGGAALFFLGLGQIAMGITAKDAVVGLVLGSVFLVLSVGQILTGTGLRRLRRWARIPTGILSGIGLLGFPIGTIINAYILHLIFSKKGTTVFSDEYQEVIGQTPHIKYRTSIVVWIVLGILLLAVTAIIVAVVLNK